MHIFFATDGSVSARFAQAQILSLPWRPPIHVTVMTAVELPHPSDAPHLPAVLRSYEAALGILHREAEIRGTKMLERARHALEGRADSVATRIHAGDAASTIVDMARACGADLVAVGSRGLGPYKGFLLGSVSTFVAQHAACTVLVAKTPPGRQRRFLFAVDGSARQESVLGWLEALDLSAGARIHIVRILPWEFGALDDPAGGEWSLEELETAVRQASPHGSVEASAEARRGQELPQILESIRSFNPQLVVMGARGWHCPAWSTIARVTLKLIEQAPCSVLVVRS